MQPVIVLCKAAIADLAITEDLLNVPERMFHFGPDAGFDFLGLQLIRIQLLPGVRPFGNEPGNIFTMLMLSLFLDAQVTGIAEHPPLITVQQLVGGYDVVDGRGVPGNDGT
jgi:hypothetical protein